MTSLAVERGDRAEADTKSLARAIGVYRPKAPLS
jgi:hypothetical protein